MLSKNAKEVISKRYAIKDENGNATESWGDIVTRVVNHVAKAEVDEHDREIFVEKTKDLLNKRRFVPNTPCLVNAGTEDGQLAACFVLPVEDEMQAIMDHATKCAIIHKTGGGTGMSFEKLRPANSPIQHGRKGLASGPVSFMNIVNTVTDTVKQGGTRRGANMGILSCSHPDILRFIHAKNDQTSLTNYNISVTITDEFMDAVNANEWVTLKFDGKDWDKIISDPKSADGEYSYNGEKRVGQVFAPDVWDRIIESAHKYAEPGIIFIDAVNHHGNTIRNTYGDIIATNPCGEQALHSYNSCNLGSIDVSKFYENGIFDYEGFEDAVYWSIRFLDNVIDVSNWVFPEIEKMVRETRPVGLGIMGLADLLIKMKIRYGSEDAEQFASWFMARFALYCWQSSIKLGSRKGVVNAYQGNEELFHSHLYNVAGLSALDTTPRNYQTNCIAPTGTISLVAECSSGIEPVFAYAYVRKDTLSTRAYVHPLAAEYFRLVVDWDDDASVLKAAKYVVAHRHELPDYYVDAHNLTPEQHVKMLAACQPYIDNSISKTVNAPHSFTIEDTDRVHKLAWELDVKAVSFYRDGSREGQVLTPMSEKKLEEPKEKKLMPDKRPIELLGSTWKTSFDGRNLYVTINHDTSSLRECFVSGPLSGSVGRLVSIMLAAGTHPIAIANALSKEVGTHSVWFNKKLCTSPEQVVAECLRIQHRRLEGLPESDRDTPSEKQEILSCPECQGVLVLASGCAYCNDCGFSKCK